MRTQLLIDLAATVPTGLVVPSASGVSGELRVLYVVATWGPTPSAASARVLVK